MTPLDGLVVVDLTRLLPGAFATLLLAELGAEVIKVEDPAGGDPIRHMAPLAGGTSAYHRVLNRGKRSVTLDLRRPEAAEVLDRLAAGADVLVESFRPAAAARLGVSAATLGRRHPRLVHCSITGFGQTGPYANRAGHDINYVALAGLLSLDRTSPDLAPRMPRMFVADIGGGAMSAVAGMLAALVGRERTGGGVSVDVSMHDGAVSWLTVPAAATLAGGVAFVPADLPITGREACYNVYRTADGEYVALGALEPKFWARFCREIQHPEWIPLQFADRAVQERLLADVGTLFAARTRREWVERFAGVDACLEPVNSVEEALADPHLAARATVVRDEGVRAVRAPMRFEPLDDRLPAGTRAARRLRPAPALGDDTEAVFRRAGLDLDRLAELRSAGVV